MSTQYYVLKHDRGPISNEVIEGILQHKLCVSFFIAFLGHDLLYLENWDSWPLANLNGKLQ
jgi:hypothetical protein